MTQTYEEYLKDVAENGDSFSIQKKDLPQMKMKLCCQRMLFHSLE